MDPIQNFKSIADEQLQDIKVTGALRERTLRQIHCSGNRRLTNAWLPVVASCVAVLTAILIFSNHASDPVVIPEEQPPSIFTPPIDSQPLIDPGRSLPAETQVEDLEEMMRQAQTQLGEPFILPASIPKAYQLIRIEPIQMTFHTGSSASENSYTFVYQSDEDSFSIDIGPVSSEAGANNPQIVSQSDSNVVLKWQHGQIEYVLRGRLPIDAALQIASSILQP